MTLSLTEWKHKAIEEEKQYFKNLLSEGKELPDTPLAEEANEEYLIETFSEYVHVEDEIDLSEETLIEGDILEVFDFVPSKFGDKFDIEVEIDTNIVSLGMLNDIKEALFADSYDIIEEEEEAVAEAEKAKVVFSRSGGNIQKKKTCAPGMRLKGNKCIAQTGTQKAQNKKKGIVLKRAKRAQGSASKKRAAVKAQITKKRVSSKTRNFSGL